MYVYVVIEGSCEHANNKLVTKDFDKALAKLKQLKREGMTDIRAQEHDNDGVNDSVTVFYAGNPRRYPNYIKIERWAVV